MVKTYHRHSIRLEDFDYADSGFYFVTICTENRNHLFGEIRNSKMEMSVFGDIVQQEWENTVTKRDNVTLRRFVIMPDHIHGIIGINHPVGAYCYTPIKQNPSNALLSPSNTVGAVIRGFKASVTTKINTIRQTPKQPIWQRNYFEHIIRNEKELRNIEQYIDNNVLNYRQGV